MHCVVICLQFIETTTKMKFTRLFVVAVVLMVVVVGGGGEHLL